MGMKQLGVRNPNNGYEEVTALTVHAGGKWYLIAKTIVKGIEGETIMSFTDEDKCDEAFRMYDLDAAAELVALVYEAG